MSRGEGELLTVPKPRAVSLLSVCLAVKPVGKPDAGNRHVRFDERGWETERCQMAQATAPILDSTRTDLASKYQEICSDVDQSIDTRHSSKSPRAQPQLARSFVRSCKLLVGAIVSAAELRRGR